MSAHADAWVGIKDGRVIARYPDRWAAERALIDHKVDSTAPDPSGVSQRTDIHRPVELITEDYDYVGSYDNSMGDPGARAGTLQKYNVFGQSVMAYSPVGAERSALRRLLALSRSARYGDGQQCDHCGAHIRFVGVLRHLPTGDHIAVGEQCLDNRFNRATSDFQALRKAAALQRLNQRIVKAREKLMEDTRAQAIVNEYEACKAEGRFQNNFIDSLCRQIETKGALSERQLEAGFQAATKEAEKRAKREELKSKPAEAKTDAPTGRLTVSGEVLVTKWKENDFGAVLKMLVKITEATGVWTLWVTVPSKLVCEKGDIVTLTASITPSRDDPSFAIGKRPSGASVVEVSDPTSS